MLKKTKKNGYYRLVNQKPGKIKILKHYKNGVVHEEMFELYEDLYLDIKIAYNRYDGMLELEMNLLMGEDSVYKFLRELYLCTTYFHNFTLCQSANFFSKILF